MSAELIGATINGKYEIISAIGAGGMGRVFKARQLDLDRVVAIKFCSVGSDDLRARFEREAQALSTLQHRNLGLFYGYGSYDEVPYIVMEYIDGVTLEDQLATHGKFEVREGLRIIKQVSDGLASAHANGIVHRDLKPGNIMLTRTTEGLWFPKLIDFGLAKTLPGHGMSVQQVTASGMVVGTLLYMSPEQCRGQEADARSDIYSLGCILYCCLTGVPPYRCCFPFNLWDE